MPQGSGLGVATHPVAQLSFRIIPTAKTLQQPHRPRPSRALYFHTIYDGDGKRVKKIAGDEVTLFVFDAIGKQIAEYSTVVADAEDAEVAYLTNDHLGSPRINTDANGAVTARHDYHPFGEEIATSQRTFHADYTPDSVRKQFTGYERDGETDLDFAGARYFAVHNGRFTTVDPLLSTGQAQNPQSWNRYSYTYNNPVNLTDPTGMYVWGDSFGGSASDDELMKTEKGQKIKEKRDAFKGFLNNLESNLAAGLKNGTISATQAAEMRRSASAYGALGEKGVTLELGKVSEGIAETKWGSDSKGEVTPFIDNGSGKYIANVVVTFEDSITLDKVLHEGSHTADRQDLANAVDTLFTNIANGKSPENSLPFDLAANITKRVSETRAYRVSSSIYEMTNLESDVWKRGMSEVDRASAISNKIAGYRGLDDRILKKATPKK